MKKDQYPPLPAALPPRRFGTSTLILEHAEHGNATDEELTWPIVTPKPVATSTFIDGLAQIGNATAEELTWPIVKTGQIVRPPDNV